MGLCTGIIVGSLFLITNVELFKGCSIGTTVLGCFIVIIWYALCGAFADLLWKIFKWMEEKYNNRKRRK